MPDESTTPDLVERAQQYLRTFERRDWDALMRFFAPNAVYEPSAGIKFEGVAEIRSFAEDMAAAFRDIRREIVDILDLGNGVTLPMLPTKDYKPTHLVVRRGQSRRTSCFRVSRKCGASNNVPSNS
jgi:ketosteroid isomerase-like protein